MIIDFLNFILKVFSKIFTDIVINMLLINFLKSSKSSILKSLPNRVYHLVRNSTFERCSEFKKNYSNFDLKTKFNKTTIEFSLHNKAKVIEKSFPNVWLRGEFIYFSESFELNFKA